MKIEMKLETFYETNGPMLFIDKMAAFLGIPPDKMRIVSITEGSVVIDFEIIIDEETMESDVVSEMATSEETTDDSSESSSSSETSSDACSGVSSKIAEGLS